MSLPASQQRILDLNAVVAQLNAQNAVQGTGVVDAGTQRRRLAEVAPHLHDLDAPIERRQFFQDREGTVVAAVVDEEHLIIGQSRSGARAERLQRPGRLRPVRSQPFSGPAPGPTPS